MRMRINITIDRRARTRQHCCMTSIVQQVLVVETKNLCAHFFWRSAFTIATTAATAKAKALLLFLPLSPSLSLSHPLSRVHITHTHSHTHARSIFLSISSSAFFFQSFSLSFVWRCYSNFYLVLLSGYFIFSFPIHNICISVSFALTFVLCVELSLFVIIF